MCTQINVLGKNIKNIKFFQLKIFSFTTEVNHSSLHWYVFAMAQAIYLLLFSSISGKVRKGTTS